jgi:signal transduction histidine kinase
MPLRHRLAVAFVLFATAALGIGGWFVYRSTRGLLERGLDEKLEAVAVAASSGIDGDLVSQLRPGDEATRLVQAYSTRLRELAPVSASAFIFDSAGGLLVASWPGPAIGDRVHSLDLYGAEIEEAWATGTATTTLFQDEQGRWYKLGFARLDDGPAVLAVAMPASFLEPLERLRAQMITFALVALAAIAVAAAILSRGLTRALEQLSGAARRIGEGQYAEPVPSGAGGEVGQLARALEEMRVAIIRREEELRLMLAQVAHEIRNPLGGIELFAGAAADGLPAEDERRGHLEKIRAEARELDRVITDFLAFAKPQEPAARRIDLRESLQEAALMIGDAGEVDVRVELPGEPLYIVADPDQAAAQRRSSCAATRRAGGGRKRRAGQLDGQRRRAGDRGGCARPDLPTLLHDAGRRRGPRPGDRTQARRGERRLCGLRDAGGRNELRRDVRELKCCRGPVQSTGTERRGSSCTGRGGYRG